MTATAIPAPDRRLWSAAGGIALAVHVAVAGLVLAWSRPHKPPQMEPVVQVELPPLAAPAPAAEQPQPQPQPQPLRQTAVTTPIDLPQVHAPLPRNPVALPPSAPEPVRAASMAAPVPPQAAPAPAQVAASPAPGDPRAKKAELDYFALLSAHLNRRKSYPPEAKKARQEGIVTVRFTVDRDGNVSGPMIRRSSGFDLLDGATLDLLRRVAPLPKMPPTMQRPSVTISLPIEYALKTS